MRTLAIVLTAVVLVGCNPDLSPPAGETTARLGNPQPNPNISCFTIAPPGPELQHVDRWKGQRGFVFYHLLTHYCYPGDGNAFGVVGLDQTLSKVIFVTEVADMNGVDFYLNLPGTIGCIDKGIDIGQVGTQNTDTGGNNICVDSVCIPNFEIDYAFENCCLPYTKDQACTAAHASCGYVADGCGGTIGCGSCGVGFTCEEQRCVRSCTRTCPKGYYLDPDVCACKKGMPQ